MWHYLLSATTTTEVGQLGLLCETGWMIERHCRVGTTARRPVAGRRREAGQRIHRTAGGETLRLERSMWLETRSNWGGIKAGEQQLISQKNKSAHSKLNCFLILRRSFLRGGIFYFYFHLASRSRERVAMRVRRFLTLATGLLECLCFCGVLFGWSSLVFILKAEDFFGSQCVNTTKGAAAEAQGQFLIILVFLLSLIFLFLLLSSCLSSFSLSSSSPALIHLLLLFLLFQADCPVTMKLHWCLINCCIHFIIIQNKIVFIPLRRLSFSFFGSSVKTLTPWILPQKSSQTEAAVSRTSSSPSFSPWALLPSTSWACRLVSFSTTLALWWHVSAQCESITHYSIHSNSQLQLPRRVLAPNLRTHDINFL